MNQFKNISIIALTAVVIAGCVDITASSEEESIEETTVQEDINHIETALDEVIQSFTKFRDGSFIQSLKTFLDLHEGEARSTEWIGPVFDRLDDALPIECSESERLHLELCSGTYKWIAADSVWIREGDAEGLLLNFPDSESASTNSLQLNLLEYSDRETIVGEDTLRLPVSGYGDIRKNNEILFAVNLVNADFDLDNNLPIPSDLDVDITTAPFVHALRFSNTESTEFNLSWNAVDQRGNTFLGIEATVLLAHSDFDLLQEGDIEEVELRLKLGNNLSVFLAGNIGEIMTLEDPAASQINNAITAEVYYGDQIIGDLEYDDATDDLLIVYKDGSSESTRNYYEEFLERLESVLFDLTGPWSASPQDEQDGEVILLKLPQFSIN